MEDLIQIFDQRDDYQRNYNKLTPAQIEVLRKEYEISTEWNKAIVKRLSKELNLKPKRVYKWRWDQT